MNLVDWFVAQALSDQVSIVGVVIGGLGLSGIFLQLSQQSAQSQTSFEDLFDERYRQIISAIPTKAMFGADLTDEEFGGAFDDLYHYIDLSNEQVFLLQRGRVRRKTWKYWRAGILSNLKRPAFRRAWAEISNKAPDDFSELRSIL